jgi:hypothetical protein
LLGRKDILLLYIKWYATIVTKYRQCLKVTPVLGDGSGENGAEKGADSRKIDDGGWP